MGNPSNVTSSMFWFFLLIILIYIVGVSLYQLYLFIKNRSLNKKDKKFKDER